MSGFAPDFGDSTVAKKVVKKPAVLSDEDEKDKKPPFPPKDDAEKPADEAATPEEPKAEESETPPETDTAETPAETPAEPEVPAEVPATPAVGVIAEVNVTSTYPTPDEADGEAVTVPNSTKEPDRISAR